MPVEDSIVALGVALSGIYFGRHRELLANPEEMVARLDGRARRGIGKL